MNDWTPLPGNLVANDVAEPIIKDFRSKYRIHTEGYPPNIPTWCTFPTSHQVDENIFNHSQLQKQGNLYFYHERGNELYITTLKEIQSYFSQRNPWETNWDLYVFNASLAWCVAVTHELADGPAVIVVGDFPQFD